MNLASVLDRFSVAKSATQTGAIGIEFSMDAIHAVQLASSAEGLRLVASASISYPTTRQAAFEDESVLVGLLRKLIRQAAFKGRRVIAAVPASDLKILSIQYPVSKDGNESKVILEMAADRLPEPLTAYVLDYIPVRTESASDQRMALVAVTKRTDVMSLLQAMRKARLDPHAVEIGPVAIRRLVASLTEEDSSENILLVNVGENRSFLTLISGRRLLMDQEVNVGQEQLLAALAQKLELTNAVALATISRCGLAVRDDSDEESRDEIQTMRLVLTPGFRSIADEVEQAFGYAASVTRGAPSRKIYLSGSLARWPGATDFLAEICGLVVERFPSPFAGITNANEPIPESGELAIATGLAMRGITEDV